MSQPKQQQKSNTSSKKIFKNVPEDFLKDIYIEPHNFIWPENPHHGEYVNEQLKHDLFFDAYDKVTLLVCFFIHLSHRSKKSKEDTLLGIMTISN